MYKLSHSLGNNRVLKISVTSSISCATKLVPTATEHKTQVVYVEFLVFITSGFKAPAWNGNPWSSFSNVKPRLHIDSTEFSPVRTLVGTQLSSTNKPFVFLSNFTVKFGLSIDQIFKPSIRVVFKASCNACSPLLNIHLSPQSLQL